MAAKRLKLSPQNDFELTLARLELAPGIRRVRTVTIRLKLKNAGGIVLNQTRNIWGETIMKDERLQYFSMSNSTLFEINVIFTYLKLIFPIAHGETRGRTLPNS